MKMLKMYAPNHWKDEIDAFVTEEYARKLICEIVWFRGQVPAVIPVNFGFCRKYIVTVPSCFDGNEGEGFEAENAQEVLDFANYEQYKSDMTKLYLEVEAN